MARIVGYDGGDGEEALLTALKQRMDFEITDAWDRSREKDMYIGSIIEIAQARGYVKASRMNLASYIVTKIGYGETHARNCLKCWQNRRDFDAVREWVKTSNAYKPDKLSGPLLFLDALKAWKNRLKPDGLPKKPKKITAAELRRLVQAYRNMLDRSGGVIVRWAHEDGRDARDWNVIVQERAALEAEYSETSGDSEFPVKTRDEEAEQEGREDTDVPVGEQHPGADDPVVSDPIVTPDPITTDATKIVLSATAVEGDARDDIERQYKLRPNWSGAKATTEKAARRIVAYRNARAHFYLVCGADLTPDEHAAARKVGKDKTTWEAGTPIAAVLGKIAALMKPTQTPEGE
jgi:hypothetical protein